jgi:hypothetical protein
MLNACSVRPYADHKELFTEAPENTGATIVVKDTDTSGCTETDATILQVNGHHAKSRFWGTEKIRVHAGKHKIIFECEQKFISSLERQRLSIGNNSCTNMLGWETVEFDAKAGEVYEFECLTKHPWYAFRKLDSGETKQDTSNK